MKTITEFAALTLRNASKTKQELVTSGKTAEELPAAMGEVLKLEGDKLNFLMNAIELVDGKLLEDLKRVIVFTLAEGEKAPNGSKTVGEQSYVPEYFPPIASKNPGKSAHPGKDDRGQRKGKGGGRGGKGGGRDGGKGRNDRGGGGGGGGRGPGNPRSSGDARPVIKPLQAGEKPAPKA